MSDKIQYVKSASTRAASRATSPRDPQRRGVCPAPPRAHPRVAWNGAWVLPPHTPPRTFFFRHRSCGGGGHVAGGAQRSHQSACPPAPPADADQAMTPTTTDPSAVDAEGVGGWDDEDEDDVPPGAAAGAGGGRAGWAAGDDRLGAGSNSEPGTGDAYDGGWVQLLSVTSDNPQFHPASFQPQALPPEGETSFQASAATAAERAAAVAAGNHSSSSALNAEGGTGAPPPLVFWERRGGVADFNFLTFFFSLFLFRDVFRAACSRAQVRFPCSPLPSNPWLCSRVIFQASFCPRWRAPPKPLCLRSLAGRSMPDLDGYRLCSCP